MERGSGQDGAAKPNGTNHGLQANRDSVEVHIEELVLHGFQFEDRHRVGDALQQELARLLEANGLSASLSEGAARKHIDAGTLRLNSGTNAAVIGEKTAQALHNGMGRLGKLR